MQIAFLCHSERNHSQLVAVADTAAEAESRIASLPKPPALTVFQVAITPAWSEAKEVTSMFGFGVLDMRLD